MSDSEDKGMDGDIESQVPEGLANAGPAILSGSPEISDESNESNETDKNDENDINDEDDTEDIGMQLGDRYEIKWRRGKTIGTVYYLNPEKMLRILPDGASDRLIDFPFVKITDPDTGESGYDFDPELEVSDEISLLNKGPGIGFVALHGFQVDQELDTYKADGSNGPILKITAVNPERDTITVKDETGAEHTIEFNGIGIPLDEDFIVLRIRSYTAPTEAAQEAESLVQPSEEIEEDEDTITIEGIVQLPEVTRVVEKAAGEKTYDDRIQKSSLLEDLRTLLDENSQKNPLALKRIRAIVELLNSLKNSVVKYDEGGYPLGEKVISLQTLQDMFSSKNLPIARPVLKTKRVLITEGKSNKITSREINVENLETTAEQSEKYLDELGGIPITLEDTGGIPRWYQALGGYFSQYPLGDAYSTSGDFSFPADLDFFRWASPGSSGIMGLTKVPYSDRKAYKADVLSFIKQLLFSLRRGHGATFRSTMRGDEIVIPSEKAKLIGYILFPYKFVLQGALGATRTGKLWDTLERSFAVKTWMENILEKYEIVPNANEKDANKVLYISKEDDSVVDISFTEYLRKLLQNIVLRGSGDVSPLKYDLGIPETEFTVEQQDAINERIKQCIVSLQDYIRNLREEANKPNEKPEIHPLLSNEYFQSMIQTIQKHDGLNNFLKMMTEQTPNYSNVDVAVVGYFLKFAQDYFYAAMANNQFAIEKQAIDLKRRNTIDELNIQKRLHELERSKGRAPERNPCIHVKELNMIRMIDEDSTKMSLLTKFLTRFDGGVEDNWITCIVCKKHLLCKHEVLQIQQFLHPKEKDVLQKQIILNFAGGRSGNKYVCRNCGQPIADLEYSTSIEYDDEGRPMMGRRVLVDPQELKTERIHELLGFSLDKETEIRFDSDTKTELYKIMKVISDTIGIDLDVKSIDNILDRGESQCKLLLTEKQYKKRGEALQYNKYLARSKISIVLALLFIEIQTHQPDYTVKYVVKGCAPGFGGFPLDANAPPSDAEKSVGINYISCAMAGVYRNTEPWINGFQTINNPQKCKEAIRDNLIAYLNHFVKDISIKDMLERKRQYNAEIYGAVSSGRPTERLPVGFLPRMETEQEANANSANSPTISEGARGELGELLKADAWIRGANRIIRDAGKAIVIAGSPFTETSCCFDLIQQPKRFWSDASLPPKPSYRFLKPGYLRQTIIYTDLQPRQLQSFNATLSFDTAYNVLFYLCYKGENMGRPHEMGFDNVCDWCGMHIPTEIFFPDQDTSKNDKERSAFLEKQILFEKSVIDKNGITMTEEMFQKMLDISHSVNRFKTYKSPIPESPIQILNKLKYLDPSPVTGFSTGLETAMNNLVGLKGSTAEAEIAIALSPLRDTIKKYEARLLPGLLGQSYSIIARDLFKEPVEIIFEVLRSYFLIPAQRIYSGSYDTSVYLRVPADLKLAVNHKAEMEDILKNHTDYIVQRPLELEEGEDESAIEKASIKMDYFITQLSEILKISSELKESRIQFSDGLSNVEKSRFMLSLLRVLFFGPIGELIDPDFVPGSEEEEQLPEPGRSDSYLQEFIRGCVQKYKIERLSYNPEVVKQRIEEANEREHQRYLDKLDKLPVHMRKIEAEKKRLGMGDWAIGGTKATYTYDIDQWEANRQAMGGNYAAVSTYSPYGELPVGVEVFDPTGYNEGGLQQTGYEEGYDVAQPNDDD